MINTRMLKPSYSSIKDVRTKRKIYAPAVSIFHGGVLRSKRTRHKTATEALKYSVRLIARWTRLYDAAIEAMGVTV